MKGCSMANGESNWLVKTLIGMLWAIIFLWLTSLTSNLIALDKDSRNRDDAEASQRACVDKEVVRLDTNQKAVMAKLDNVENKVNTLITAQAVTINNQETIMNALKDIKQSVK